MMKAFVNMILIPVFSLCCALAVIVPVLVTRHAPWGYRDESGPRFWSQLEGGENCDGQSQSPIDIVTADTVEEVFTEWRFVGYHSNHHRGPQVELINNNGRTVNLNLLGNYFISGGGLPSTYRAVNFHFHWGDDDAVGSEHTKNGQSLAAEMHIVHYDSKQFDSISEAVTRPDGLAVLGVWIKVGKHNPAFEPIIDALDKVQYKGEEWRFDSTFRLIDLLPSDLDNFYRYSGSLTTPGCFESVVWTIFDEPIQLSKEQILKFRQVRETSYTACHRLGNRDCPEEFVGRNYRPVQNLHRRTVFASKVHAEYDEL